MMTYWQLYPLIQEVRCVYDSTMKTPAVSESVANQGDTVRLDMANTSIGHGAINVQLS